MSIDAINPLKRHVKGNLRLICLSLNSQNNLKRAPKHMKINEIDFRWMPEKWKSYIYGPQSFTDLLNDDKNQPVVDTSTFNAGCVKNVTSSPTNAKKRSCPDSKKCLIWG